jgi:hypothetical protein
MSIKHHEHNHYLEERGEHLEEAAGEARPVDHAHHGMGGRANHAPGGHHDHTMGAGHDRHAGHSVAMFRDKFSLALTIPVVPPLTKGTAVPTRRHAVSGSLAAAPGVCFGKR